MNQSVLKQCFHNCLFVESQESGLVPFRYTHAQCRFYDEIPYGLIMGDKSRMSAGITLEFDTDAPEFTLCWQIAGGYPTTSVDRGSSVDVFINGVLRGQKLLTCEWHTPQEDTFTLGQGQKHVVVCLPHTYIFSLKDIVLPEGASFAPVPQRARKVLMLGDSITQGIGARYASMGYAMQVARMLDAECINQSVAAVRFEPECLENDGFMPDLITIALGANDWSHRADKAEFDDYASRFLARINELYPNVPTAVVSPVKRCRGEADLPEDRPHLYRESGLYDALLALSAPYPQMHCIDGWQLMPHVSTFFQDGLHPNDLGMTCYAHALYRQLIEKVL